jgi:hypothetical protein
MMVKVQKKKAVKIKFENLKIQKNKNIKTIMNSKISESGTCLRVGVKKI